MAIATAVAGLAGRLGVDATVAAVAAIGLGILRLGGGGVDVGFIGVGVGVRALRGTELTDKKLP